MNRKLLKPVLINFLIFSITFASSGSTVTFKNSTPLNGTAFGYKFGIFNPFIGFDFQRIEGHGQIFEKEYDDDKFSNGPYWEMEDRFDIESDVVMPFFGLKLFLSENEINTYLLFQTTKIIPNIKVHSNGWERNFQGPEYFDDWNGNGEWDNDEWFDDWNGNGIWDSESWEEKHWDDHFDLDNSFINMGALQFGIGFEYNFSGWASIGGEYGLRVIGGEYKEKDSTKDENNSPWYDEWDREINTNLPGTYTNFTLNIYF